jgi:hypothetical protein
VLNTLATPDNVKTCNRQYINKSLLFNITHSHVLSYSLISAHTWT